MSLTIPARLVKISVLGNFTPGSFLHNIVFYLDQFIVLKDNMLTAKSNNTKNAHFTELKVTRLFLDGEIWTQVKGLVRIMHPIYYTDQIQRCLDSFFRKSSPPKRMTTKKKYSFKPYRRLPRGGCMKKERTFHQLESRKAFTCLQFDESKQTTFCSVYGGKN